MKDDTKKNIRDAAIVGVAAHQAPRRLLGYHVVRHGTTKENAKKIKSEGLQTRRAGSGAGDVKGLSDAKRAETKRMTKGRVYFSKNPIMSNAYASMTGHGDFKKVKKREMFTGGKGKTVKARITDRQYRNAKADIEYGHDNPKWNAASSNKSIPSRQIVGGKGSKGIMSTVNKNTLKGYIKSNPGRFGRGVALAGAGAAAGGSLINRIRRKHGTQSRSTSETA